MVSRISVEVLWSFCNCLYDILVLRKREKKISTTLKYTSTHFEKWKGERKRKKINISFSQNPKHIWRDAKISMTQFCLQKIDAHFKHITHSQNCLNWDWFYGHCNNMLSNAITSPQSKPADKNPHKIIHEALKKNTFFFCLSPAPCSRLENCTQHNDLRIGCTLCIEQASERCGC